MSIEAQDAAVRLSETDETLSGAGTAPGTAAIRGLQARCRGPGGANAAPGIRV